MEQDPNLSEFATLKDYVCSEILVNDYHLGEKVAQNLGIDLDVPINESSVEKGEERLYKAIAENHDVMLLDEPQIHLDVEAIEWLEAELKSSPNSYIIISHDRKFLSNLTNDTIWLDRGQARRCSIGFGGFEAWRDKIWHEEDKKYINLTEKFVLRAVGQ